MTIREYELRIKAYHLRRLDKEYEIHLQAWTTNQVKAQKKKGSKSTEPYFKNFDDFFDYEKREKEILGISTSKVSKKASDLLKKANS